MVVREGREESDATANGQTIYHMRVNNTVLPGDGLLKLYDMLKSIFDDLDRSAASTVLVNNKNATLNMMLSVQWATADEV